MAAKIQFTLWTIYCTFLQLFFFSLYSTDLFWRKERNGKKGEKKENFFKHLSIILISTAVYVSFVWPVELLHLFFFDVIYKRYQLQYRSVCKLSKIEQIHYLLIVRSVKILGSNIKTRVILVVYSHIFSCTF